MRNWAVVRGHAPGGGFPCESTYAELRIRQNESAVPEVRLSGCLGDRERMEQGCECLSGSGNALSDQCGAYLLHLFAKIHCAGHLKCVRCVCMCTCIYAYICTHKYIYTHKYKYLKFIYIYIATYIKLYT